MMSDLKLIFVAPVIEDSKNNTFVYDLYFSETPEIVWGNSWDYSNPSICDKEDIYPQQSMYSKIERINSSYKLGLAINNAAYPLIYCINDILALSWIDIEELEEYPQNGRCVLKFGMDYKDTMNMVLSLENNTENTNLSENE